MADELVTIQPNASALAVPAPSSSWGDDEEPVKPRYIKIRQTKSKNMDEFELGNFVDKEAGEQWEQIEFVPLSIRKTRKFQSPYNPAKQSELYCRSANRVVPVTTDDRFKPKAANCADCAYGQKAWKDFKTTGQKPANPCEQEIEFLGIIKGNPGQPYILVGSGQSRPILEDLYDKIKNRSKAVLAKTGVRPEPYEYEITFNTVKGEGTRAEFWYPNVVEVQELTREEALENYGDAYEMFVRARREAFEAAKEASEQSSEVDANLSGTQTVVETPAPVAEKPVINATFLPPASKRVPGTKPVYKAPAAPIIDAKAEIADEDIPF